MPAFLFLNSFFKKFYVEKNIKQGLPLLVKLCLVIIFVGNAFISKAQGNTNRKVFQTALKLSGYVPKLHLRKIIIIGNKKTKEYIILREMQLRADDSVIIANLQAELKKARDFIYNTTLFVDVKVSPLIINANDFDIIIEVKERWYIFPIPYVEAGDRSFNEWIKKDNADLHRVSYGIMVSHFNISGRNDKLLLTFINGFKRKMSFEYTAPYINKKLTHGIRFGAGYFQSREIGYKTDYNNNLLYYKNQNFVKNEWYVKAGFSSKKGLKKKESFLVTFRHLNIDDSIISYKNPGYFNNNSSTENFIELDYKLQFQDVDNILYPLKGSITTLALKKKGLQLKGGINEFSLHSSYNKFFSFKHGWYSSIRLDGEIKLPFTQSYYNQKLLGYEENYMRGNEYFVIDGVAYGITKLDLKKKILFFNLPTFLNSKAYSKIPFSFYAKTFVDAGYVYNKAPFDSRLNNRLLYSAGFGLDVIIVHDYKISIEYSFNQLNQKGLFLHH